MARVNVEQTALSDPRFAALATLLELKDADHAIGKMVRVWNTCQELGKYNLPSALVAAVFGDERAPEALVASSLARKRNRGTLYIRGTKGRIEWLNNRRKDGKTGGRPRKTLGFDKKQRRNNPPAPAPAPTLLPDKNTAHSPSAPSAKNGFHGFDDWWAEMRAWFKFCNRPMKDKAKCREFWKQKGCAKYADRFVANAKKQRQHYEDQTRSGGFAPGPKEPLRYLKRGDYNAEIP